jgi:TRAP-type C4-dicarboxylate transport system permease small subunit
MHRFADACVLWISRVSCFIAMLGMALLVLLFAASIGARMVGLSAPGVDDLSAIVLAAVFAFGMAAAVGAEQHLAITLLTNRLPPALRTPLQRLTEAATVAIVGALFVGLWHLASTAYSSNQKMLGALPIPRYVPMGLLLIGVGLFVLALTFQFLRNLSDRGASVDAAR